MMKNRRDMLILAGLFLALVLFVAFGPGRQQTNEEPDLPSSYSAQGRGALALYRWARELGYDAQRLEYRAFELAERDAALFILGPSEPISAAESRAVREWVEGGGTLLLADDSSQLFGLGNRLLADLEFETAVYSGTAVVAQAVPAQPVLDRPPTGSAEVQAERILVPQRDDFVPLLGTPDALLVAGVKLGRGYVYLSSTVHPFTNDGLRNSENAALLLNILRRVPPGSRILFDEIHHGLVTPPPAGGLLFSTPWGWAGTYAVLVTALYLILSGRRFGRPVPLKAAVARRSSAEYIESMADLFQRGGKRAYIAQHYYQALKRRLAKPYAINPQLDDAAFVRELANARELDAPALEGLLARLRATPASEAALVQVVAEAEAWGGEGVKG